MAAKAVKPTIRFAADFDAYKRELKRALGQTDKFDRKLKGAGKRNNFRSIGKAALGAAAGIGAVSIAANELRKSISQTTDLAKATRQLQRATGLASEDASRLAAVLKVRGIDTDKLGRSFTTLARQIEAAKVGTGGAADAFRKLGVAQGAIRNGDVSSILIQSADGFQRLGDGTTKAAVAQQLFGRSSRDLIPLLEGGGKALRDQLGLAPKLSDEQVQQALAATMAQRNFNLALLSLRVAIATAVLPYISKAATALSNFITQIRTGTGAGGAFRDRIVALSDTINSLVSPLTKTNNRLVNIGVAIAGVGTALAGAKIISGLTGFGSALVGIFSNPYLAAAAGVAALIVGIGAAAVVAYKKSKPFKELIDDIGRTLSPIFRRLGDTAKKELPKVGREFNRLVKDLSELLKTLRPVLLPIIRLLGKGLEASIKMWPVWLGIAAKAIRTTTTVLRAFGSAIRSIIKVSGDFKGAIKSAFGSAVNPIRLVINAVKSLLKELKKLPGASALGSVLGAVTGRRFSGSAAATRMTGARTSESFWGPAPGAPTRPDPTYIAGRSAELEDAIFEVEARIAALEGRSDKAAKAARRRMKEFIARANAELKALERANAVLEARRSLEDQITQARLAQLNATLDQNDASRQAARNQNALEDFQRDYARLTDEMNASTDFTSRDNELTALIAQAQGEQGNAAVQANYQRQQARLQARLASANARGDLEEVDQINSQLAALEERYGADRVQRLIAEQEALRKEEQARQDAAREERDRLVLEEQQRNDDIARANNEASAATYAFTAAVKALIDQLVASRPTLSIAQFLAQLAQLGGPSFSPDSSILGVIGASGQRPPRLPRTPVRPRNRGRASGGMLTPGALTLVGETGPELVLSRGGGTVVSGSRTQRLGSANGVTLNVYPRTTADDPVELARALGWQLATR